MLISHNMKKYTLVSLLFLAQSSFAGHVIQQAPAGNKINHADLHTEGNRLVSTTEQADSTIRKPLHNISFDIRPEYTLPTNHYLQGQNGVVPPRTALAANLKYGFRFAPDSYLGRNYPYAIQGIGVGYHSFFNPSEMGNPLAVYVFQTSRIATLARRLSLDYEWNFGISFGWKKYDPEQNPWNTAVGSKANAYINLGLLLNWQLSAGTNLKTGISITHFSNGNTHYPNAGINTAGGYIGVCRTLGQKKYRNETPEIPTWEGKDKSFWQRISYDALVYGAVRKKGIFPDGITPVIAPGVFAVAGMNFTPLYQCNRYFRTGLSLDMQYDESANIVNHLANPDGAVTGNEARFYKPPFREQFGVGLSARAEIVMPVFSINIGIGKNLICRGADTNSFYQILALKTDITRNLFLHVGYQLYRFKDPNNLMLGIGYRFRRRTAKPVHRHQTAAPPAKKIKSNVP